MDNVARERARRHARRKKNRKEQIKRENMAWLKKNGIDDFIVHNRGYQLSFRWEGCPSVDFYPSTNTWVTRPGNKVKSTTMTGSASQFIEWYRGQQGLVYRVSKHARVRFEQRFGSGFSDKRIISTALKGVDGYTFIWGGSNEGKHVKVLVTVLFDVEEEEKNGPKWRERERRKFEEDAYLFNIDTDENA